MAAAVPELGTHEFAGEAWNAPDVKENIEPVHVWMVNKSWRMSSLFITTWFIGVIIAIPILSLYMIDFYLTFLPLILLWGLSRPLFRLIPQLSNIHKKWLEHPLDTLASRMKTLMLRIVVEFARRTKKSVVWSFFWCMYFHFAIRRLRMIQNYLAAWRTKYPDYYLVIFVDNEGYMKLPCPDPEATDDKFLVSHLETFYRISQIERGLIRALLPKNRVRLDIVDLLRDVTAGRAKLTLDLGYRRNRRMQYFEDPSQLEGRRFLVNALLKEQVFLREIFDASAESTLVLPAGSLIRNAAITATQVAVAAIYPGISSRSLQPDHPQALNFVCGWDAHTATFIILFPTVLSIVVGIAWPAHAVLKYGADVQTSVQTGVSVASYIVTAGKSKQPCISVTPNG